MEAFKSDDEWADCARQQQRTRLQSQGGNAAGNRRRKLAVQVGRERREALIRGKRLRKGNADEYEDANAAMDEDATAKDLEQRTLLAVQELEAAGMTIAGDASGKKVEALRNVRKLLSSTDIPPLTVAVNAGVVPLLVNALQVGSSEEQLVEAAWCVTNIASGDQQLTKAVQPALPILICHLGDQNASAVAEQCAWAIGNVAGESEDMRSVLIAQGALIHLGKLLLSRITTVTRTAAWALSNLIKGPQPAAAAELMNMEGMPKHLVELLMTGDEELVIEIMWVMVYITSMSDDSSVVLLETGILPPLVNLLATAEKLTVLTPVVRCIGNIVAGENSRTDEVLAASAIFPGGLTGGLARCLDMGQHSLQKDAAWALCNISAGTLQHKELVFQSQAFPSLLRLLSAGPFDVRKEAAYVLGNICIAPKAGAEQAGVPLVQHLKVLVQRGCIPGFLNLVKSPDAEAVRVGLQFLDLAMRGLPNKQGLKIVEEEDGIAAMEMLQFNGNEDLRNMAYGLVDKYFGEDYGLEEEYGAHVLELGQGIEYGTEYPSRRDHGLPG